MIVDRGSFELVLEDEDGFCFLSDLVACAQ